ncbi:MAG: ATP synthase F1 subunit gamma [Bacteroidia bacterium]
MANLKEVRSRIASTISTQQITKAMKLVSATKLRRAQTAITQMRPYADKLNGILVNLADSAKDEQSLQGYFEHREVKNVLIIVNSSDRGLCGAFNSNVTKEVKSLLDNKYNNGENVEVMFLGKKAYEFYKRSELNMNTRYMDVFSDLTSEEAFSIGQHVIDDFLAAKYDEVRIVYNKFKNAATQIIKAEKMLPVEMEAFEATEEEDSKMLADFTFEPSKAEILFNLIPRAVKTQLYRTLLDSQASEHGARMVAMDSATENAGEILNDLKLQYNQARQAAITKEILEIVGGAAALEG